MLINQCTGKYLTDLLGAWKAFCALYLWNRNRIGILDSPSVATMQYN